MRYRILGTVEVSAHGRPVVVARPQRRALLALLLLNANRAVSPDAAAEALWGPAAPKTARAQVHSAVYALRAQLRDAGCEVSIPWSAGGYTIHVEPGELDAARFASHLTQAKGHLVGRRFADAASAARAGLRLWRGEPLGDARGAFVPAAREHLHERRRATLETLAEAELAIGNDIEVLSELAPMMDEYPLHEAFCGLLMRALHRAGRTAEALDRFRRLRAALAEQHGLDPGPVLTGLEGAILRGELAPAAPAPAAPEVEVPAQLPPDVYGFSGRATEIARLDALLSAASSHPTAVMIAAVSGIAGIGKTALAVHWAHRTAGAFPDGQLYLNLRGYDQGGAAVSPEDALHGFLDALGVSPHRVPASLDARTGLFRSMLAGRRMLVLLDNARDAEQVRPLLPGAASCAVIVTSRNQLPSLVAAEGAHALFLDVMSDAEARELLARRIGAQRTADRRPLDMIIAGCANLPLALAVVAARAATSSHLSLDSLAADLHAGDARDRLDALAGDDRAVDVREVFSWSYHLLGAEAARLFRLLGLHPGPHVGPHAAASLAGLPANQIRPLLAELATASLATVHDHRRYTTHDLLHVYATELTDKEDADDERRAALRRLLDHYLHTSRAAALRLNPPRDPIALSPPAPGTSLDAPADHDAALGWLTAERPALLAMIRLAVRAGFDTHAWQLAWTLDDFLDRRGHWADQASSQETALAAARSLADLPGQAQAHTSLGRVYQKLARYDDADAHLRQALDIFGQLGDDAGRARAHYNRAQVSERRGRYEEALRHAQAALELCRASGHRLGQANTLSTIGWHHSLLGRHREAVTYCEQALALHQEIGDRHGEAAGWDSLGHAHQHLGRYDDALASYRRALALCRELGDRYNEAGVLTKLGDTQHARGAADAARDAWSQAVAILDELDHPDAEALRPRLAR
ncbi:BTAD domain-containing putative transcriptional regulator [Micromonospora sp. WMMD1102]|uniref:AfsR/SARP family transcriptional regulator n=1 Tax=Micromonospora sp. WMMD1102 TaxID=3016105 RepID=UPI00241523CC|nr:BTAD domain-containing putative transcriptional regulator [Micromonospora sp. WMMD1102]MDG4790445.1 BTAD domain-containing putative transcriptional regulator [Micromonospora sp. WMMD1102]